MEAASKARAKLGGSSNAADNKAIAALYDELMQLEGISQHLPILVQRLQQLANLHTAGASFQGRLQTAEQSMQQLEGFIQNLQSTLAKVEKGMLENLSKLQTNIELLDERLVDQK